MVVVKPGLLQTKLAIPSARTDRVPRPHLIQKLDAGLERPLTLICAPAGFGKTSLITDWYEHPNRQHFPLAWLSLDEDDNDPIRFFTYVAAAIETVCIGAGDKLLPMLQSPQPPPLKDILTSLLNHVDSFSDRFILVVDDYHVITAQPVHEALTFLLDHLTTNMRLLITSRSDPVLPLGRLRARDQLAEFRADNLRFTLEETVAFLQSMLGVQLSSEQITALDARTEGWIAGLQLAALAMKGRKDIGAFIASFTGSHRFVLDYLVDEVLSRQPEPLQNFLLQSSILNRFNGSLCDAVTGRADGQESLEQIERGNLFLIPLDDQGYWYRYHHLFGDMLRKRLQKSVPDNVPQLHRRASEWFEQNGWLTEAIEHIYQAHDNEQAACLIEQHGDNVWMRGEVATFLRWLKMLPEETLQTHPKLCLNYAFVLTITDAFSEAEHYLLQAEQALLKDENFARDEHSSLLSLAAVIRTTVSFQLEYDADIIISAAQESLAQLPESALLWRTWIMILMGCTRYASKGEMTEAEGCFEEAIQLGEKTNGVATLMPVLLHLSRMYIVQGRLKQSQATANRLYHEATEKVYRGQARLTRSKVRYESNDLSGSLDDAIEGWENTKDHPLKRLSLDGYVMLARLKQLQGAEAEARDLMQQAAQIVQSGNLKQTFIPVTAWQAWLWLMQHNMVLAAEWAGTIEPTTFEYLNPALEFEHIILARIQMAQGRLDEAQHLLERLLAAAKEAGRMGRVIEICVLQALAAHSQGNMEQALEPLTYALALSESEGYVRTFLDHDLPMAELLREAQIRGIAQLYVGKLLADFQHEVSPPTVAVSDHHWIGDDVETLSERELEVLKLIGEGASNREIAEQLVVSLGTVKKHISNIFIKLNAESRTQVIVAARKQNLL